MELSCNIFKYNKILQLRKLRDIKNTYFILSNYKEKLKFDIHQLYYISKNRAFCEWYYYPTNGGGRISKCKMMMFISCNIK